MAFAEASGIESSSNSNAEMSGSGHKRKRTPIDEGRQSAPPPAPHSGGVTQINYLMRAKAERLKLIEGDSETFSDILGMIDDYEGVLQRHESLAANLGAKLVGPLLLKSFEKLFDGPIRTITASFALEQSPVSWLDVVTFARTNPLDFGLSDSGSGAKACRFWIKGGQVEISEDDYRLVMSGGPERMIPTQALPEDETAELETLNILENRLVMLIKRADAVASKARQLNYHLKGRKTAVLSKKVTEQTGNLDPENRNFTPQPFSHTSSRSNGESLKIQQHLLDQFTAARRQSIPHGRPKTSSRIPTIETPGFHTFNGQDPDYRRLSHPLTVSEDGNEGQYRVLIASKIEKLSRGDPIYPPCDRCRRLKFDCTKHLTACQACTKKHAKCSWKDIKDGELEYMPHLPIVSQHQDPESRQASAPYEENLDPGLRTGAAAATGPGVGIGGHPMIAQSSDQGSEHAVLTQIATAAAGR
ncbi:hypothetical protein ONS95_012761 [Cadophora gregata]|uniref:uncharacterized protein n=1 Tax=Cadophora gregata TaxID=51156 RepID=UPI0026DA9AC6|nr:uncharacterized protein ONS95_012761 [Cadophora gregata]KAK0118476.1 hypothetical protein ONS95_012761 [Cadophora gregata]KAK0123547.1 hypothetical protein ONS96_010528 [Cadophora gregata f. sp. sojae]